MGPGTCRFASALVIANPIAGRGRARARAQEVERALGDMGLASELHFTAARGDARRLASEARTELVVVVGGDGTVAEVLSGLSPDIIVAVLPMGTANVLSQDLKLPRDVPGLMDLIRAGNATAYDVADVNGRLCFLVTGVGFDGAIVREVERRRRGPITKWFYVRSALHVFWRYRAAALRVTVDGVELPQTYGWVLVTNMIGYGGFVRLWPDRRLDDGKFELFLFPGRSRWALVRYAWRSLVGSFPGGDCQMQHASVVRITASEPTPYEVDGDFGGETPIELRVRETQFKFLMP